MLTALTKDFSVSLDDVCAVHRRFRPEGVTLYLWLRRQAEPLSVLEKHLLPGVLDSLSLAPGVPPYRD